MYYGEMVLNTMLRLEDKLMKKSLKRVLWYIKLWLVFARISLQSQLEYRLNFISGVCIEIAYMLIKLIYLVVVTSSKTKIGFLTPDMVMLFIGIYIFMTGIWMFFSGVNWMPGKVISGQMDLLMTKPGSLQFLQTLGTFDFALAIPNVVAGIVLVCISWGRVGIPINITMIGGFVYFLLSGIILTYTFALIPALLVFWVTSINGVFTFYAAIWDFNTMPMELYPKIVKQIGTFIIPVFIITNWSGLFVLDSLSTLQIIWGIILPSIVFIMTRILWNRSIRRYVSANG